MNTIFTGKPDTEVETMATIEPGLAEKLKKFGAVDFPACYNCGNCTAVCSLTAKDAAYPRIFLRYGSVGLGDRLIGGPEPWLCYACGECSAACPRDAGPGDFMAALRRYSIAKFEPTGLTRLLFTNNPFAVVFMTILAVILGLFLLTLKPENPVARWIFEWMPFNVIHDMGLAVFILTGISGLVGAIMMGRRLFAGMPRPKRLFSAFRNALREVGSELAAMKRYRKCVDDEEPYFRGRPSAFQPWFVHWTIMWGFLGLLAATTLDFLFKDPATTTWWPSRVLGTVAGISMMYGTTLAFVYRIRKVSRQYRNTRLADWTFLGSLFLAGLTGFWMEAVVMGGYPGTINQIVFVIHTVVSMELVLLFAFSKFAHAAYRPMALFSYFLRRQA